MAWADENRLAGKVQRQCTTVDCKYPATHLVRSQPGYGWYGYYCADHAEQQRHMYDHQGGCIINRLEV